MIFKSLTFSTSVRVKERKDTTRIRTQIDTNLENIQQKEWNDRTLISVDKFFLGFFCVYASFHLNCLIFSSGLLSFESFAMVCRFEIPFIYEQVFSLNSKP